jgi:hypothetical protein
MSDVDEYQLEHGILGLHPDEFYGAIGRVVCVCAVLEDQVTTLRHTLAGLSQGERAHEPVDSQIKGARSHLGELAESSQRLVGAFLDDAKAAFAHRNELVHSSFPAQPDGRLWGHRPARDRAVRDGRADTVETSLEDLRAFIGRLSALVRSFNQVHAAAGLRS